MAETAFLKLINGYGIPPKGKSWEDHVIDKWQAYKVYRKRRREKEIIASEPEVLAFVASLRLLQPHRKVYHLDATLQIFDMLWICCPASLKSDPDQQGFMGETAYRWAMALVNESGSLRLSSLSCGPQRPRHPVPILTEMILSRQINLELDLERKVVAWKDPEHAHPFTQFIEAVRQGLPNFKEVEGLIDLRERHQFSYDQIFWKKCIRDLENDVRSYIRDVRALQTELADDRREFADYAFIKTVGIPTTVDADGE